MQTMQTESNVVFVAVRRRVTTRNLPVVEQRPAPRTTPSLVRLLRLQPADSHHRHTSFTPEQYPLKLSISVEDNSCYILSFLCRADMSFSETVKLRLSIFEHTATPETPKWYNVCQNAYAFILFYQ